MKKFLSVLLVVCLLLPLIGACAEVLPVVSFAQRSLSVNGGNLCNVTVKSSVPVEQDTLIVISCAELGRNFTVTMAAGSSEAQLSVPTEKVEKRTAFRLKLEKSLPDAYTIGKDSSCTVTQYTQPRVEFYSDVNYGYVGQKASVPVICRNRASVLPDNNIFQLRDQAGRVFAEKKWKDPSKQLTFVFDVTADMTGRHDFTVWCNDVCVSDVGYGPIADLKQPIVQRADITEPYMAITIDCAYFEEQTDAILDVLDKYDVKATFFMTGYFVRTFTGSAQKIAARGHEIGNHSNTHPRLTQMNSMYDRKREIQRPTEDIEKFLGARSRLFRPPFGAVDKTVIAIARAEGQEVVMWTFDSHDWDPEFWNQPDKVIKRVTKDVLPGTIVLFHLDGFNTPAILDQIIPYYQNELGMKLVPVSKLLELSGRELPPVFDPAN